MSSILSQVVILHEFCIYAALGQSVIGRTSHMRSILGHLVKGNMHHKYDMTLKDSFNIVDMAPSIHF